MTEEKVYECEACKKRVKIDFTKEPSLCCGMEMKQIPLDACTEPPSAEFSRPMDDEEPCDDSRSG